MKVRENGRILRLLFRLKYFAEIRIGHYMHTTIP